MGGGRYQLLVAVKSCQAGTGRGIATGTMQVATGYFPPDIPRTGKTPRKTGRSEIGRSGKIPLAARRGIISRLAGDTDGGFAG